MNCLPKFLCLYLPTKWSCRKKEPSPFGSCLSLTLFTSLPFYSQNDIVLTVTYLINQMPSCALHLQTPFDVLLWVFRCTTYVIVMILTKLNSPLGHRHACFFSTLCTNEAINASIHPHTNTLSLWMSTFLRIILSFPLVYFMGRVWVNNLTMWFP